MNKCMCQLRTTIFGAERLSALNQELILSSSRQCSADCQISELDCLVKGPFVFFTDGRGFVLYEYVLREQHTDMPFHPVVFDVLSLLSICPAMLSVNGWRILLSFIIKCRKDGVAASTRLFFFFFYPH